MINYFYLFDVDQQLLEAGRGRVLKNQLW